MTKITPEELYILAKEALAGYNIDLSEQPVSVDAYLKLTAYSVIEQFSKLKDEEAEAAFMASITALTLENFLLNLKLLKMQKIE